jgi:hypothetical protein
MQNRLCSAMLRGNAEHRRFFEYKKHAYATLLKMFIDFP